MLHAYSLARVRLYKVPWTTILLQQEGSVRGRKVSWHSCSNAGRGSLFLCFHSASFPQSWGEGMGVLGRGRIFSNIIEIGKTFLIKQAKVAFIILVQEIQWFHMLMRSMPTFFPLSPSISVPLSPPPFLLIFQEVAQFAKSEVMVL